MSNSNVRTKGIDLDNVFLAYTNGVKADTTNVRSGGQDLRNRYVKYFQDPKADITNIKSKKLGNKVDLNEIFQAKINVAEIQFSSQIIGDGCVCEIGTCEKTPLSPETTLSIFINNWNLEAGSFPVTLEECHNSIYTGTAFVINNINFQILDSGPACCNDVYKVIFNETNFLEPTNTAYNSPSSVTFCYPGGLDIPGSGCQCSNPAYPCPT